MPGVQANPSNTKVLAVDPSGARVFAATTSGAMAWSTSTIGQLQQRIRMKAVAVATVARPVAILTEPHADQAVMPAVPKDPCG
jgi:hypothetical protein